jgi:tetratricopeptide (TPR) repeat protein
MIRARLVTLALLLSAAAPARAADPLSEARDHYEQGMSHYQLGEFVQAIDEFKLAYAASHAPGLLFNLAQASRLAKQYDQALFFYRSYLRARPEAPNRVDVEARIAELEPLAAAQRHEAAETRPSGEPPAATTTAPAATATVPAATATAPAATANTMLTLPPLLARPRDGKRERIAGLVTGGVGLAALGVGIYFGTRMLDAQDRLARVGNWDPSAQSLYSNGHNDAIAATTLYVAGGVAVAAGAALYLWGWRRDVHARRFAVVPLPGGAQASFACAF